MSIGPRIQRAEGGLTLVPNQPQNRAVWRFPDGVIQYLENDASRQVDRLCSAWWSQLVTLAGRLQVSVREVDRQARLHLPSYELDALVGPPNMPDSLVALLEDILMPYGRELRRLTDRSRALDARNSRIRRLGDESWSIESPEGVTYPVSLREVNVRDGEWIESDLHYLHNFRPDVTSRLGIYLADADAPLAYASYRIDQEDYIAATAQVQLRIPSQARIGHVVRVYGVDPLPANTMSLLYALVARHARQRGGEYLTTAINPFLGFHGRSVVAAGFRPYAVSPVACYFDTGGRYRTWRNRHDSHEGHWLTPHNVLLVRGATATARKRVNSIGEPLVISRAEHDTV